jgi:endonuclease/exonuclease/phosphatase family metal-dependent hydrolase
MPNQQPKFLTKKISVLTWSIFGFNILAAFLLLVSQLSAKISPEKFWITEIIALGYPFILLVNVGFIIYWIFHKKQFAFISFIVILLGYDILGQLYQPSLFKIDVTAPDNSIKVISYNVRLFDLYNWNGNLKTRQQIFHFFKSQQPDILCLQEYYTSENPKLPFSNNDTICKLMDGANIHTEYGITLRNTDHWGLATFSKFPILNQKRIFYREDSNNFGMYTDLLVQGDTIRVFNVHMQSNHFKRRDYEFLQNPDSGSNEKIYEGVRSILARLKKAAKIRAAQIDELSIHISECPFPYIICGDFNDPPFSYAYQSIVKYAEDSFHEKGKGLGTTYIGSFPPFRIDYIFHDKHFETITYTTGKKKLSDHYPVIVEFTLNNTNE